MSTSDGRLFYLQAGCVADVDNVGEAQNPDDEEDESDDDETVL